MKKSSIKKYFSLLIILIVPFLLVGCGKSITQNSNQLNISSNSTIDNTDDIKEWIKVEQNIKELTELQSQVDEGHMPGLLDPIQVAAQFTNDFLNEIFTKNGKNYQIHERDDSKLGKIISYQFKNNCQLELRLNQPVRSIWAVEYYLISSECK